jgi:hypothetical protein
MKPHQAFHPQSIGRIAEAIRPICMQWQALDRNKKEIGAGPQTAPISFIRLRCGFLRSV